MKFNERLIRIRESKGWNKTETAKRLGVTVGAYANWEYGNREPDIKMLRKISKVFDVSADYLINNNQENANTSVGAKIKLIRLEKGLSMQEFGKKFDPIANRGLVSGWENGRHLPNAKRLSRIADLGGTTVEELLHGSQNRYFLNISENIKNIRKERNETQEKFAKSAGISRSYLGDLENNRKSPSLETIQKIANKLGVSVRYLLEGQKTIADYSHGEREKYINPLFVGKRIFDTRMSLNMTQAHFGKVMSADRSLVSKWENGLNLPNKKRIEKIARLANISIDDFLYGNGDKII